MHDSILCRIGQKSRVLRRRPWENLSFTSGEIVRHLQISHHTPCLPPEFFIIIFFYFSCDHCNTQEKSKTKVLQIKVFFLGGGGGGVWGEGQTRCIVGDVARCANFECLICDCIAHFFVSMYGYSSMIGTKRKFNQI